LPEVSWNLDASDRRDRCVTILADYSVRGLLWNAQVRAALRVQAAKTDAARGYP